MDFLGAGVRVTVGCMIENPHILHTHSRSTLYIYIYKVFQHLLQWLVVIRMQLQPDIALGEVE